MAVHELKAIGLAVGELSPPRVVKRVAELLNREPTPSPEPRKRRPTLTAALRAAKRAGVSVRVDLQPDGRLVVTTLGEATPAVAPAADDEAEQWISKHAHRT
jgi:hypothetical protein